MTLEQFLADFNRRIPEGDFSHADVEKLLAIIRVQAEALDEIAVFEKDSPRLAEYMNEKAREAQAQVRGIVNET